MFFRIRPRLDLIDLAEKSDGFRMKRALKDDAGRPPLGRIIVRTLYLGKKKCDWMITFYPESCAEAEKKVLFRLWGNVSNEMSDDTAQATT